MAESLDPRNRLRQAASGDVNALRATRSAWLWGSVVVAFLILQLVIGGLAYKLATGDPSVAVMPDYHQRALHWDDEIARRKRSDQLGWTSTLQWDAHSQGKVGREFAVQVKDSNGNAIAGGQASLRFFHHTRGGDVATMNLKERSPGEYVGLLPMSQPGLWDVEFSLARDEDEAYWRHETLDIASDVSASGVSTTDAAE
jgi:nitrogen fixation protein FixH